MTDVPPEAKDREETHRHMPLVLACAFVAWSFWLHAGVIGRSDVLLGEPGSDVLRGLWTLHHTGTHGLGSLWTDRVFFPVGAFLLPLPLISSLLLSPLFWLFSPITAYNFALPTLLAANALAAAWLCREWTDRWWPGALAAVALCGQPLLLHAIGDGTPEHLALWPLLAAAAAGLRSVRTASRRWALATAALLITVALDSPYTVIFGVLLLPLLWLPAVLRDREPARLRALAHSHWPALALLVCGAVCIQWLYSGFSLAAPAGGLDHATALSGNSVQLRNWWQFLYAPANETLGNLVPAYLPTILLIGGLVLTCCAPIRNAPWLIGIAISLLLALGVSPDNAGALAIWWGSLGRAIGNFTFAFNEAVLTLPLFEHMRFPRRWLVVTALCLGQGAASGLASLVVIVRKRALPDRRMPKMLPAVAAVTTLVLAHAVLGAGRDYRRNLPHFEVPVVAFADWIAEQPGEGAVVLFPTLRKAEGRKTREQRSVYANLPSSLSGGDETFLQVLHDRPVYSYPGLQTLAPLGPRLTDLHRLIREIDDLTGIEEVPSRTLHRLDNRYDRQAHEGALDTMHAHGIRWLVFDKAVYAEAPLAFAESLFASVTQSRQTFADGAGVVVLEIGR